MRETTCRWVKKKLAAYGDQELNAGDWSRVTVHLNHCPDCARLWEKHKNLDQMLSGLPVTPPPAELAGRIMAAIGPPAGVRASSRTGDIAWWDFSMMVAGLLLGNVLLVVAVWLSYLGFRYSWSGAPLLLLRQLSHWWNSLLGRADVWGAQLKSAAVQGWITAINLPAESGVFISRGRLLKQFFDLHHSIITYVIPGLVVWLLMAYIVYFCSRRILNEREERV